MAEDCACPLCGSPVMDLPVSIIPERGMVVAGGKFALLTGKESAVLACLAKRYPRHVSKEQLMAALYEIGADDEPDIKIIDVFICKIRKKIEPIGIRIDTIWGYGYAMAAPSLRVVGDQDFRGGAA